MTETCCMTVKQVGLHSVTAHVRLKSIHFSHSFLLSVFTGRPGRLLPYKRDSHYSYSILIHMTYRHAHTCKIGIFCTYNTYVQLGWSNTPYTHTHSLGCLLAKWSVPKLAQRKRQMLKDAEDTHRVKEAPTPIFSLKTTAEALADRYKVQKALKQHMHSHNLRSTF